MRRTFRGNAVTTRLMQPLEDTDSARVLTVASLVGWDFIPGDVFEISVDRGTDQEEKILCSGITYNNIADPAAGGQITVWVDALTGGVGRPWDDTTRKTHPIGAKVEHVWTAIDAREALNPTWGSMAGKD